MHCWVKTVFFLAPIGLAFVLSDKTLAGFCVMLIGGLVLWIPYWFAWWLSDGFENTSEWSWANMPDISGGINPSTGKLCTVYHHPWGTVYVDDN